MDESVGRRGDSCVVKLPSSAQVTRWVVWSHSWDGKRSSGFGQLTRVGGKLVGSLQKHWRENLSQESDSVVPEFSDRSDEVDWSSGSPLTEYRMSYRT